jgi:hypothetical protein
VPTTETTTDLTAMNAASFGVVDEERDLHAIVQVELGQQA